MNRKLLPVTLGIFGDWGSGKTSIMKMLEADLDPEKYEGEERAKYERMACLYFNGWLFEGYDDAKSAILTSILLQLGEHKRFGPKVQDGVVSLLKSVNWMRLARLGIQHVALPAAAAYITGGASLIPSLAASAGLLLTGGVPSHPGAADQSQSTDAANNESTTEEKTDWEALIKSDKSQGSPLDVRSFRERFAKLLSDSDIQCLVILIDDLDRCSPERIVENLEAIKLFLNVDETAFVIGADPRIVRHAIELRYGIGQIEGLDGQPGPGQQIVNDYLEKLIQVPYSLPRLSPSEVETYMSLLFCLRDLDAEPMAKCLAACETEREKNRYGVFGYAQIEQVLGTEGIPEVLGKSMAFGSSAAPLVTEGLKGNPRQVKRFLNAFTLRRQLANVAELVDIRDDVLVKLMVLEYAQPKEFRQLFDWQTRDQGFPKEIGYLETVLLGSEEQVKSAEPAIAEIAQWKSGFLRKWIAMEPRLTGIDLRDYFWVARDKLESTFSGVSMISPVVRRVLEDLISGNSGRYAAAGRAVSEMTPGEVVELLNLLEQHVSRHLDQKLGYDGLRFLIEKGIPGSAETLATILQSNPPVRMPAAVGTDVCTLVDSSPDLGPILNPAIAKLSSEETRIGKAIQNCRKKGV